MAIQNDHISLRKADIDQLLGAVSDMLIVVSPDGFIHMINEAACTLLGYSEAELQGQPVESIFAGMDASSLVASAVSEDKEQRTVRPVEYRCVTSGGHTIPIRLSRYLIHDERGNIDRIIYLALDISERQALEAQLRRTQKLSLIGQLARGVAHDLNNILSVVMGRSEFLMESETLDEEHRRELEEIRQAGTMAMTLTHHILDISRPQQGMELLILDLNAGLTQLWAVLDRILGDRTVLELECDPDLGFIQADQAQIEQILLNLLVNARDAMPRGGKVTIETANRELDETQAHVYGVPSGEYVSLTVCDTGEGMDNEVMSHIFEPFYTTKPPDKGTGLGLSTVYGIVKQLGGGVTVESEEEQGTTFTVLLPRIDPDNLPMPEQDVPDTDEAGLGTVLLVEDSPALRSLMSESLRRSDFIVLVAKDGPEAIQLMEQHEGPVDMLVTDVVIQNMAVEDLVGRIQAQYPSLQVLYMSAFTDSVLAQHGVTDPALQVLRKPFTEKDLVEKVRAFISR